MTQRYLSKWSLRTLVFFFLFFLYIWWRINPVLYYQRQEPVFFFDSRFFHEFLTYAGGLVEYLSAFLSQFYYYSWAGALMVTLIAWLTSLATLRFIKSVSGVPQVQVIHFFPAILLLILHSQYGQPLALTMGLLIALSFSNLYLRIAPPQAGLRLILYLFLAVILYYLTGGPFLLFAVLCGLFEWLMKDRPLLGLSYLLFAGIIPYGAVSTLFMVTMKDAYLHLLPLDRFSLTLYALYLLFVLIIPGAAIYRRFFSKQPVKLPFSSLLKIPDSLRSQLRFAFQTLVLFLIAGLAALVSFDKKEKTILQVDYYARHRMWPRLLQVVQAERWASNYLLVAYQTNRALYHTGRLGYDLFSFPQRFKGNGLLLPRDFGSSAPLQTSDIYFDLGLINEAEHWAYEALSIKGETPWNLQRLALINILKGKYASAHKYLAKLDKTLLYQGWAKCYLSYLDKDSLLTNDKELQQIRARMVDSDFIIISDRPETNLESLLLRNRQNKMAFEYLVAYYLITSQLGNFFNTMERFYNLDYFEIPRHYQEALTVYVTKTNRGEFKFPQPFRLDTIKRYHDFVRILNRYHGDKMTARDELRKNYGDTYWFYLIFNGGATK